LVKKTAVKRPATKKEPVPKPIVETAKVGVDSGSIEFTLDKSEDLTAAEELHTKVMDLSCWTALVSWDGKNGAVKTPNGDGLHNILYRHFEDDWDKASSFLHRACDDHALKGATVTLRNVTGRRDPKPKFPETYLILGDCRKAQDSIKLRAHRYLGMGWSNSGMLMIVSS